MEKELVFRNESGVAVTTSYLVAKTFGKEHFHVVRDIDILIERLQDIECQDAPNLEGCKMMFSEYTEDVVVANGGVKQVKSYFMNRDGFVLLVMGYTGQKALEFKLKYIAAFNKMETELKQLLQKSIQESQRAISVCNGLSKELGSMNSRIDKVDNRLLFIEKRTKAIDNHRSPLKKPAKPAYLTISEAIGEFSSSMYCIDIEDFYHCLRELGYIGKEEDCYNRPRGQFAVAEMIIAVNVKPSPEEADTENQDFTLLFTPGFVKTVIENVKWLEAYGESVFPNGYAPKKSLCRR